MAYVTRFGSFGAPPDGVALTALVLGLALLALGWRFRAAPIVASGALGLTAPRALSRRERLVLFALCGAAALLSAGYVAFYLRGGPRIIDATSYWLESLTLASGSSSFELTEPSASFRGRFLLSDGARAAPIFPPGYPAVLALGQLAGEPMAVGPLLGGLLVLTTFHAARWLFPSAPRVWWLAAVLSLCSACLRYHSADTMSHALCAVLISASLAWCLAARHHAGDSARAVPRLLGAGLALGLLFATRPVSCLTLTPALVVALWPRPARVGWLLLGALPGVLGALWHQASATGELFGSTQLAYYALADGPPGCFGYGFGARGCVYEHGDFVQRHLPHGYGLWEASGTTLRRLMAHLKDAGNLPLFALMLPVAFGVGWRRGAVRLLGLSLVIQALAYAPFYFDGNYPGGGARLFVDVVPLEHVLLAYGLTALRLAWLAPGVSLLGFALHASYDHQALATREGGRPMFEPSLTRALPARSVVFVDTDHGFNLGHDPRALARARGGSWSAPVVARERGDARDALLLLGLGSPPAYRYEFNPHGNDPPRLSPWRPSLIGGLDESHPNELKAHAGPDGAALVAILLEAEADYPPVHVKGGFSHVEWPPGACVSGRRGLRLRAPPGGAVTVRLELTAPEPGRYVARAQFATMEPMGTTQGQLTSLLAADQGALQAHPAPRALSVPSGGCTEIELGEVSLGAARAGLLASGWLELSVTTDFFVVDRVTLTPIKG